ncbi:hypothetical protein [Bryobacter aggregatus]|uniref:hypothetical protein n=1 Tax=Bryobacter aggregatus TaxID=360054 RepID=UPI0012BB1BFB|nr:hypothetical protein [Bryobacter aggregatus]
MSYTFLGAWLSDRLKVNLWHWPFFFGILTTLLLYCSLFAAMLSLHLLSTSPTLMAKWHNGNRDVQHRGFQTERVCTESRAADGYTTRCCLCQVYSQKAAETAHLTKRVCPDRLICKRVRLSGHPGCSAPLAWRWRRGGSPAKDL